MSTRPGRPSSGRTLRRAGIALLLLVVAAAVLIVWRSGALLQAGHDAFRAGRYAEAAAAYESAARWRLRPAACLEGRGIAALGAGDGEGGRQLLERAASSFWRSAALEPAVVVDRFLLEGDNLATAIYADYARAFSEDPTVWLASAGAHLGLGQVDAAAERLQVLEERPSPPPAVEKIRRRIRRTREEGAREFLFDRRGRPLASVDLETGRVLLVAPDLAALLDGDGGLLVRLDGRARSNRLHLALDLEMQRAATRALRGYRGALVALDPATGGVLAVAENHREPPAGELPLAFHRQFEPGSIVKILTETGYLRAGNDPQDLVPLNCGGNQTIDGRVFYDWTTHGRVPDLGHAMAVSCNLAFARMGLALGRSGLDAELERMGFGGSLETEVPMELGRFLPVDEELGQWELARRAVGLDSLSITPVHAALIASALAAGGTAYRPVLISQRINALDLPYATAEPVAALRLDLDPARLAEVRDQLVQVVTDPRGTGRRAAIDGLEMALKTGTSGERPFDSLVVGFAPLPDPGVAFAIVLDDGGKAELNGARVTKRFLETLPKDALVD